MTIPFSMEALITLAINLVAIIWLAATVFQKVKALESDVSNLKRTTDNLIAQLNNIQIIEARMDEKLTQIVRQFDTPRRKRSDSESSGG